MAGLVHFTSMTDYSSDEEETDNHEEKGSRINNNKVTEIFTEESMNDKKEETVEGVYPEEAESLNGHQEVGEEGILGVENEVFSEHSSPEKAESLNGLQEEVEEEGTLVVENEVFSENSSPGKAESLNGLQEEVEEEGTLVVENEVFSENSSPGKDEKEEEKLGEGSNKSNLLFGADLNIEEDNDQVILPWGNTHKRPELQGEIDSKSDVKRSRIVPSELNVSDESKESLLAHWMKLPQSEDIDPSNPIFALESGKIIPYKDLVHFFTIKGEKFRQLDNYDQSSLKVAISNKFTEGEIIRTLLEFDISGDIICRSLLKIRRNPGNNWAHIVIDNTLVPTKFSKKLKSGEKKT